MPKPIKRIKTEATESEKQIVKTMQSKARDRTNFRLKGELEKTVTGVNKNGEKVKISVDESYDVN